MMIYFDNAATTYPKPNVVYDAINEGMKKYSFNAGRGSYSFSSDTYKMINDTREKLSAIVNQSREKVVFTGSATESINMIINGLNISESKYVYISPFEHNAIVRLLEGKGIKYQVLPFCERTWQPKLNEINDLFVLKPPSVIFLSHISNVVGYELPYDEIFNLGKKMGAITVLDSAQGFGIFPIKTDYVDFIVFAGHKSLYASFGIAGFINISNIDLITSKFGGTGSDSLNLKMPITIPDKYEPGSLNSVGIFSINKSVDYLKNMNAAQHKEELAEYLIQKIVELDGVKVFFPQGLKNKGIVSFAIENYSSQDVGEILANDYDICVRTGYHCAPLIHNFIDDKIYSGTIRVSLGIFNTKEEIDFLVEAIRGIQ